MPNLGGFEQYLVRIILSWDLEKKSAEGCKEMLSLINSLRQSKGAGQLRMDETASKAAVGHARDMYTHGFFSHTSPTFGTPAYRLQRWYSLKVEWKNDEEGELISKRSSLTSGAYNEWAGDKTAVETLLGSDWHSVGIGNIGDYWVVILLRR
jgi:uncharacterized protein YkwD